MPRDSKEPAPKEGAPASVINKLLEEERRLIPNSKVIGTIDGRPIDTNPQKITITGDDSDPTEGDPDPGPVGA